MLPEDEVARSAAQLIVHRRPRLFAGTATRPRAYRLAKMAAPPIRAPMAMPAVGMAPAPSDAVVVTELDSVPEADSELPVAVEPDVSVADESSVAAVSVPVPVAALDDVLVARLAVEPEPVAVAEAPDWAVAVRSPDSTCEWMEDWMLPRRALSLLKALLAASWADEAAATADESTAGVVCWA